MKTILFSSHFPKSHHRAGEPTNFRQLIESGGKDQTIRASGRFKVGDWFEPRTWTGLPYRSPQVQIASAKRILRIRHITIDPERVKVWLDGVEVPSSIVAQHDGLTYADFWAWFNSPFTGYQIEWGKCDWYQAFFTSFEE